MTWPTTDMITRPHLPTTRLRACSVVNDCLVVSIFGLATTTATWAWVTAGQRCLAGCGATVADLCDV